MNFTAKQIFICTLMITAMLGLMNIDIARTDTKDKDMTATATELPAIDRLRPQQSETAIFALG